MSTTPTNGTFRCKVSLVEGSSPWAAGELLGITFDPESHPIVEE